MKAEIAPIRRISGSMLKSVHGNAQDTSCMYTHLYKGDFHASGTEKASKKICLAPNKETGI